MENKNKHIKLNELEKKTTYKAPDGYFDKLPYSIQERINHKKSLKEQFTELPIFIKLIPASLMIIFLSLFFWSNPANETPTFDDLLTEVTDEEILEYLYWEDFTTYDIVSTMDEYDSISMDLNTTEHWLDELSDDELESIFKNYDYDTSIQYY